MGPEIGDSGEVILGQGHGRECLDFDHIPGIGGTPKLVANNQVT